MTITPEKLAELREKALAYQEVREHEGCEDCRKEVQPAYRRFRDAADPQTVLALVEEVERLRKENAYWMEECYHQQAKAERLEARAPERQVGS